MEDNQLISSKLKMQLEKSGCKLFIKRFDDICDKYAIEFFGKSGFTNYRVLFIRRLLERNDKQGAENYIWNNCLFNND